MAGLTTLRTARLELRPWREDDLDAFAAMHTDPEFMAHLPGPVDRAASDAMVSRIIDHAARHGFGRWAVEVVGGARFIGFVGLSVVPFEAPFTPAVEVGWRLARAYWGIGYATEAALAALEFGFQGLGLNEIVSFTVPANQRSRKVMERIGMTHSPTEDFDYPLLPEGHPLRRHVLYRTRANRSEAPLRVANS